MQPIKAVGVEVISHTVAAPTFSSSRVGAVALSHSPTHPQVGSLRRHVGFHVVHHHLVVPLLVLSGALTCAKEDVGPYTASRREHQDEHLFDGAAGDGSAGQQSAGIRGR